MVSVKGCFRAIRGAFSRKKKNKGDEVGPEGQPGGGIVEMQPVVVHLAQGDGGGRVIGVDHVAGGHAGGVGQAGEVRITRLGIKRSTRLT